MIKIQHNLCDGCGICVTSCPFGAIAVENDKAHITPACTGCKLCINACPQNAMQSAVIESAEQRPTVDKAGYRNILVFAEHAEGHIAPVTLELIGKARVLAQSVSQQVCCLFIGDNTADTKSAAAKLLDFGVSKVYVYLHQELKYFKADTYTNIFYDCVERCRPTAVLVGATAIGRSLAPRIATRCQTGLTADCTGLTMRPNTDLIQTRPAFGGNIMAQIVTEKNRPQFATVRERVMDMPEKVRPFGKVEYIQVTPHMLSSDIMLTNVRTKQLPEGIDQAHTLVVAGKIIKTPKDMEMLRELAKLLGGRVGATRPVVEAGLADHTMQIGLSGRSVRPKLIITCGVSGAVQFMAGMKASEHIFAINTNPQAPIMKIAHYAAVGDAFEIVPALIERIKREEGPLVI